MFARQAVRSARFGVKPIGTRNISSYINKATGIANTAVYWSKVTLELGKQIYIKEGLAPPSVAELQSVYQSVYKQLLSIAKAPKPFLDSSVAYVKTISKDEGLRYGAYFIQIVGLFSLGEMIGRRQIVGYPSFGPKEEHHH
ncbi:hypothetical protein CANARDRAFT_30578 [[Candida] arabinofermentans NRRL YB-2248]|uniref:Uncharacterized protein n=1 Tax=[Candida] arabinofermentans NRRL YB-2248 TaxID=983967 RepID=A0A1E4STM3_9ASCO|nr:hypothetical protein CANARDRAFT_30578 [[Candida] arabinofermentans NRRL YB-2248]